MSTVTLQQYETAERELSLRESLTGLRVHAVVILLVWAAVIPINIIVAPGFHGRSSWSLAPPSGCSSTGSATGARSKTSAAASSGSNNAPPRGKEVTTAAQPLTRQARGHVLSAGLVRSVRRCSCGLMEVLT